MSISSILGQTASKLHSRRHVVLPSLSTNRRSDAWLCCGSLTLEGTSNEIPTTKGAHFMRGHLQLFASGPNNEDAVDLRGAGRPRWNLLAKTSQTHPTRSVFVFQKRSVETSWKLRTPVTQIFSTSGVASEVSANSATIFLHDPWHCFRDYRDPTPRRGRTHPAFYASSGHS